MQAITYACSVVLLFSGFVLVSRAGLSTALTLPDIAALRFGIGGLLLLPIVLKHGFSGSRPAQALALSTLGGLGFALFAYAGFALAPAAHGAVLLHGTLSLTTAMLLWAVTNRLPQGRQTTGLVVIGLGIVAMAWDGFGHASWRLLLGDACLLAASLCWSGYGLYVKELDLPATRAAAIVAVVSALAFLPVYAALPGKMLFRASLQDLLVQGLFQGVLIGAVSIFVYTRAVSLLGAARVALFTAAVPGLTAIAGYVFLDEAPSLSAALGVMLVTSGLLVSLRRAP